MGECPLGLCWALTLELPLLFVLTEASTTTVNHGELRLRNRLIRSPRSEMSPSVVGRAGFVLHLVGSKDTRDLTSFPPSSPRSISSIQVASPAFKELFKPLHWGFSQIGICKLKHWVCNPNCWALPTPGQRGLARSTYF